MATVYSIQKTKWDQTSPALNIKPNEMSGRRRVAYGEYEAAALAAADVVEMFNLPVGARIMSMELTHDALGAGTTLSVGYAAYNNADGTAVVAAAAGYKAAAASTAIATAGAAATVALGRYSVVDADQTGLPVTVTVGGAAATGTIYLVCEYVVD